MIYRAYLCLVLYIHVQHEAMTSSHTCSAMKTFLCAILLLFPAVGAWYPSAPSCADAPSTASLLTPPRSGRDLALFFATDTYTHSSAWRKLYAPVRDAKAIAADLHDL